MVVRNKTKNVSQKNRARGSWFELIVLILMLGAFYVTGALMNSSWTGAQGRMIGESLRRTWGGALLVPLLFLIYLCAAWFAKSRVPRPWGQIAGTLQLYLTTAFVLGLVNEAHLGLPWVWAVPGNVGNSLAKFFILNLGAMGAIIIAFASLALASILFGFKLPILVFQAMAARFIERKERKVKENIRTPKDSVNIRPLPRVKSDDLFKETREPVSMTSMTSTPIDGLDIFGEFGELGEELTPSRPAVSEAPTVSQPPPAPHTAEASLETPAPPAPAAVRTPAAAPPKPKPQTATEMMDELLASLNAETEAQTQTQEDKASVLDKADKSAPPPPPSAAYLAPERVIEVQSPVKPVPKPQTTIQEAFPEIDLPEDTDKYEPSRLNDGLFPPPLDIFGPPAQSEDSDDGRTLAEQQAETIVETLQNFGVKANVAHIIIGPSVIQFQLELAPGIKVSKVSGLANDLTMALAVVSVRVEAPILGQRYVGIEIPNPLRKGITLRSIMESDEFQDGEHILPLPMGVRVDSQHLVCGLEDMPHLLVAGTTGSGKSVFMNACILGMCSQRAPDELKLILVDPKHVEFAIYEGLPHLLARPVSDPKKAISALTWAVQEMETRSEAFAKTKVRNLASYNEKVLPKSRFPHIVVVVDELADLMYTAGKEVEGLIARLAQKARAAGIHLILATQRPSVDVITGLIKANVPARVAFAVPSQTDSRTIIDTGGAEKLLGKGDMLFYSTRYPRPLRLQAGFITEERTLEFVEYAKNVFGEPDYIEFEDYAGGGSSNGERSGSSIVDDPKLTEAVKVVMDTGIASASGLQRYLNVGYPRAGRLISGLEQLGIVGPQTSNSSKPRDILMDEESAFDVLERARNGDAE
ncbi:MAG: FtsK/SpoIIIE domain-containing protein [Synergistaceae bacterium]|nr:FtsK/SpoIIIE domain-containing protein [Synergistaceae bacterium]